MSQAIKVGIFVSICLAILAVLIFKVEDLQLFGEQGQRVGRVDQRQRDVFLTQDNRYLGTGRDQRLGAAPCQMFACVCQ